MALPLPISAQVTDELGRPVPGVKVRWRPVNGLVSAESSVTDGDGYASVRFTSGFARGEALLSAAVAGDSVKLAFDVRDEPPDQLPYDLPLPLSVPTFDGSSQLVHPDVAVTPFSFPQRLAITPYPGGDAHFELPSLYASESGLDWVTAPDVSNPVVPAPAGGYMSDPDLLYNPETAELWLYYRYVGGTNAIWLIRSPDGSHWGRPVLALEAPNHNAVSPAIVRRGPGDWSMWVVNSGPEGCTSTSTQVDLRTSTDGIHWSDPEPVHLDAEEFMPWHIDVQWIPSRQEFWALYNAKASGSCATPILYLATSKNGLDWIRMPVPVQVRATVREFQDIVYRSTFRYDPIRDDVWLWMSGARFGKRGWRWSALQVRRHRADLMATAAWLGPAARPTVSPHPLIDWP